MGNLFWEDVFSFVGALYEANMADQSISMGIKKDPIDGATLVPYKGIFSRDFP